MIDRGAFITVIADAVRRGRFKKHRGHWVRQDEQRLALMCAADVARKLPGLFMTDEVDCKLCKNSD